MEFNLQKFREAIYNLYKSKGETPGVSYPGTFKPSEKELNSFIKELKKTNDPSVEFYVISENYSSNYHWGKSAIYYSYYHMTKK